MMILIACIFITSSVFAVTSNFNVSALGACTNSCDSPKYFQPTQSDPCNCVCPIDAQLCRESGLLLDNFTCQCVTKPSCTLTNSCPPKVNCNDGTLVDLCNRDSGKRCVYEDGAVFTKEDSICLKLCNDKHNGNCPQIEVAAPSTGPSCCLFPAMIGIFSVVFVVTRKNAPDKIQDR